MREKYCPRLENRIFVRDKIEQGCITNNTFSIKSHCSCPRGSSEGLYLSTTIGQEIGASPTGITCWFLSLGSLWGAQRLGLSPISPQRMPKGPINSDSVIPSLSGILFLKQICFETRESSKSLLSIWCLLPKRGVSQRNLSSTDVFMPLTPQPSTSVCPYSDGAISAVPSLESKSIPRLTSRRRYPYFTASQMQKSTTLRLWIGLSTSPMQDMYSIGAIMTSPGSSLSTFAGHSSSSGRRVIPYMRLLMGMNSWEGKTMSCLTKPSVSLATGTEETTRLNLEESFTTLKTSTDLLSITRTISTSQPRTSHCSTAIAGKWSSSSSGLSSICWSRNSGVGRKTQSEYSFMWLPSLIVLWESSSTTSKS